MDPVDLPADLQLLVRHRRRPGPAHRRPGGRARRRRPRAGRGHEPVRAAVGRAVGDRAAGGGRQPPPGLRPRGAGQLVPRPGHGAGQRGGHRRRAQRARQLPGVQAAAEAVDDAHHRVRRPADRRPRRPRLARGHQAAAAQLDRAVRGRPGALPHRGGRRVRRAGHRGVHHPARHPVRRHLHGAGPRAPAGRAADGGRLARQRRRPVRRRPRRVDRWARHAGRGGRRLPPPGRRPLRGRAPGRGPRQDRRVPRAPTRPTPPPGRRSRCSSPTTC